MSDDLMQFQTFGGKFSTPLESRFLGLETQTTDGQRMGNEWTLIFGEPYVEPRVGSRLAQCKMSNQCRYFEIRHHATGEQAVGQKDLADWLTSVAGKWIFQKERSDTGYEHFQGHFHTVKKVRATSLRTAFNEKFGFTPGYLMPTADATERNILSLDRYASNIISRIEGPWRSDDREAYIPVQYRVTTLRPYQQMIWDSFDWPHDRKVRIIYDPKGNEGKTVIAARINILKRGIYLPQLNDFDRIMQFAHGLINGNTKPGIIIFDMPRAGMAVEGVYRALESLKNGWSYDTRYAAKQWWFDSPQVWVMTNTLPEKKFLSEDRWVCYRLDDAWRAHEMTEDECKQARKNDKAKAREETTRRVRRRTNAQAGAGQGATVSQEAPPARAPVVVRDREAEEALATLRNLGLD